MVPKSYSLDKVYGSYYCELCSLLTMRPTHCEQTIASYVLLHVYTCTYMCMSNYMYMYDDTMCIYMYK